MCKSVTIQCFKSYSHPLWNVFISSWLSYGLQQFLFCVYSFKKNS